MNEYHVESSFLRWLITNYVGTIDTGVGKEFNETTHSKWVYTIIDDIDFKPFRSAGKAEGMIQLRLQVYVRNPTNIYEAAKECGTLRDLLMHADIPIKDYEDTLEPQIGYIRFNEPKTVDASNAEGGVEIQCKIMTVDGTIQET